MRKKSRHSIVVAAILLGGGWLVGCTIVPTPLPVVPVSPLPAPTTAPGGPSYAHVVFVRAIEEESGTWRFEVTVQHDDEGEDHYADRWEIHFPLPDGRTLRYTRELAQPHLEEQPFSQALSGIEVPEGVLQATVVAHDSLHGYGGQEVTVNLNAAAGPGFVVVRK
ncbi:MAG: hypothetical protein JXA37_00595 [Chloroflexia bacterium]|nr:hypothetical protein [Chloroflexia bacterium]